MDSDNEDVESHGRKPTWANDSSSEEDDEQEADDSSQDEDHEGDDVLQHLPAHKIGATLQQEVLSH